MGKLTGFQVKLHVDLEVPAVAQPVRCTPFSLREKGKEKIEEFVTVDIIEPIESPTAWVSPVVVVPKQNDEIRLRVDMRRANKAIIREPNTHCRRSASQPQPKHRFLANLT